MLTLFEQEEDTQLPPENIQKIISFLNLHDMLTISATSKQMREWLMVQEPLIKEKIAFFDQYIELKLPKELGNNICSSTIFIAFMIGAACGITAMVYAGFNLPWDSAGGIVASLVAEFFVGTLSSSFACLASAAALSALSCGTLKLVEEGFNRFNIFNYQAINEYNEFNKGFQQRFFEVKVEKIEEVNDEETLLMGRYHQ